MHEHRKSKTKTDRRESAYVSIYGLYLYRRKTWTKKCHEKISRIHQRFTQSTRFPTMGGAFQKKVEVMAKRYQSNQIKYVFLQTFRQAICHRQCFLGEKNINKIS